LRVDVLLSDAAQVDTSTGKVNALGIGWTRTSVPTGTMAVIVLVSFDDEEEAGGAHEVTVTLTDNNGKPVPMEETGLRQAAAIIELNTDANPKWPATAPLVIPVRPGLPLKPDHTYQWRVAIDGKTEDTWFTSFGTEPPAPPD